MREYNSTERESETDHAIRSWRENMIGEAGVSVSVPIENDEKNLSKDKNKSTQ